MKNYLLLSISFTTILTILSCYTFPKWVHYFFKPVTTLLIIALALISSLPLFSPLKGFVLLALTFSLFGDVFLMFKKENFFLPGLVSFLIAHIFYILAFYPLSAPHFSKPQSLGALLGLLLYGGVVFSILKPKLGSFLLPVFIYMLVLLTMTWFSLLQGLAGSPILIFASLLFVASDTTLAFDKFYKPFKLAQVIILSTYFAAQTLFALFLYYR